MSVMGASATLSATVKQEFVRFSEEDDRPLIRWITTDYSTVGESTPSKKPIDLTSAVSAMNMPDGIKMTLGQTDFIYLFLGIAGMTTDKDVKVGDVAKVHWKSRAQNLVLDGTATILDIKPLDAMSVRWDLKAKMDDNDLGEFHLTSRYDPKDLTLKTCEGAFQTLGINQPVKVKRLDDSIQN
jgi:hypothetical protein